MFCKKHFNPHPAVVNIHSSTIFFFNKVNIEDDLFLVLRDHREFVVSAIYEQLHPRIHKLLQHKTPTVISVHVRRGDFKIGNMLTPLSHFIQGIALVRNFLKEQVQVTIFTDADLSEILPLMQLGNISIANEAPDIADILLMSRSQVIFTSQSSSFSYWAAFFSDALVVIPSNDWQKKICNSDENLRYCEVRWKENDSAATDTMLQALKKYFQLS